MLGRGSRQGVIRQSLNSLDRGRIPLPGWLLDALALWSFATGLLALLLVFRNSVIAPLLLIGSALPALLGAWISFVNVVDMFRSAREQLGTRKDYSVLPLNGDLRFVREVVLAGRRSIGQAHPGAKMVTTRVSENPAALCVYVRKRSDGKLSFCGYVLLYPLRDELGEAVLSGAIRSEAEFGYGPLFSSFGSAKYLYVGMILGVDEHARWQVKDKLRGMLIEILLAGKVERVFARPGTSFGEAMMKEYGFTPIHHPADVWSVAADRLKRRLIAEEALNKAILVTADDRSASPLSPEDA